MATEGKTAPSVGVSLTLDGKQVSMSQLTYRRFGDEQKADGSLGFYGQVSITVDGITYNGSLSLIEPKSKADPAKNRKATPARYAGVK